jgi:hypothetical protein
VGAQASRDVLPSASAIGHQDDLQAVAQLAVLGAAEQLLQALGLGFGQLDADHGYSLLLTERDLLSP